MGLAHTCLDGILHSQKKRLGQKIFQNGYVAKYTAFVSMGFFTTTNE